MKKSNLIKNSIILSVVFLAVMSGAVFAEDKVDKKKEGEKYLKQFGLSFVKKDKAKAIEYLKKSAELGNPKAKSILGMSYLSGKNGLNKDVDRGIKLIKEAVDTKNNAFDIRFAVIILVRNSKKTELALELLNEYKDKFLDVRYTLGRAYYLGYLIDEINKIENNPDKGTELLKSAADAGHIESKYLLGEIYRNNKNYDLSFKYYKEAADLNHPKAYEYLSEYYRDGLGCKKAPEKSAYYKRKILKSFFSYSTEDDGKKLIVKDGRSMQMMFNEVLRRKAKSGKKFTKDDIYECKKLGIRIMKKHDAFLKLEGLLIFNLSKDSLAEGKGILPGDIITEINGRPVKNSDYNLLKKELEYSDNIKLTTERRREGVVVTLSYDISLSDKRKTVPQSEKAK